MNKKNRMAMEILSPAMIAVGGILLWGGFTKGSWPAWNEVCVFLVFAYGFATIPSLLYAAMMEKAFDRGLDPHSWATVRRSTWLGVVAGAAIGLMMAVCAGNFSLATTGEIFVITGSLFAGIGLVVGLILGLLIKSLSPAAEARPGHRLMRWDQPFDGRV